MRSDDLAHLLTLDLTHVQYSARDPWGAYWALVTLSPVLILAVYVAAFLHRRDLIFVRVLLGHIGCEALNGRLKREIQEPRPTSVLGMGYGMPSSHAQFSGFFCAFWCWHIVAHWPRRDPSLVRGVWLRRAEQGASLLLVLACTALTCYSRVHLMYHTADQVKVGVALGGAMGLVYYALTEWPVRRSRALRRLRVRALTLWPSRALRLRDEYVAWRSPMEHSYTQWMQAVSEAPASVPPRFDASHPAHLRMMLLALQEADRADAVPTAFSVGCVLAVNGHALCRTPPLGRMEPLRLTTGYSRELPGNTHAEECAMEKLLRYCARTPHAEAEARRREPLSLIMYTTMEPCSARLSGLMPCAKRILAFNERAPLTSAAWLAGMAQDTYGAVMHTDLDTTVRPLRISVVVQGVGEPDDFVKCEASRLLRSSGVAVHVAVPTASPAELGLTCPPLRAVPLRVSPDAPCAWLQDACLRMARKGYAPPTTW